MENSYSIYLKNVPKILIIIRLLLGVVIYGLILFYQKRFVDEIVYLMVIGFLTDVFDGIIARRLNVSDERLRKWDSIADRIFWMFILLSCYSIHSNFFDDRIVEISSVLVLELVVILASYLKFRKYPSPHNILSKIWAILIIITLGEVFLRGHSDVLFPLMIGVGILSRIESLAIHILIKKWDHDIPTLYHAYQLRKGRSIKRSKILNG